MRRTFFALFLIGLAFVLAFGADDGAYILRHGLYRTPSPTPMVTPVGATPFRFVPFGTR